MSPPTVAIAIRSSTGAGVAGVVEVVVVSASPTVEVVDSSLEEVQAASTRVRESAAAPRRDIGEA